METSPFWVKQEHNLQQVGMLIEIQIVASSNEDFNLARVWWPFGKAILSNRLQVRPIIQSPWTKILKLFKSDSSWRHPTVTYPERRSWEEYSFPQPPVLIIPLIVPPSNPDWKLLIIQDSCLIHQIKIITKIRIFYHYLACDTKGYKTTSLWTVFKRGFLGLREQHFWISTMFLYERRTKGQVIDEIFVRATFDTAHATRQVSSLGKKRIFMHLRHLISQ